MSFEKKFGFGSLAPVSDGAPTLMDVPTLVQLWSTNRLGISLGCGRQRLKLVPPEEQLTVWRSDYSAMKDEMFFGKPPAFEDLMETVREFQDEFNQKTGVESS